MSKFEVLSWDDLVRKVDKESKEMRQAITDGKTWGNWRFCEESPKSLHFANSSWWIPLTDLKTTTRLGETILHLGEKLWISGEDLGNFCQALRDIQTAKIFTIQHQ